MQRRNADRPTPSVRHGSAVTFKHPRKPVKAVQRCLSARPPRRQKALRRVVRRGRRHENVRMAPARSRRCVRQHRDAFRHGEQVTCSCHGARGSACALSARDSRGGNRQRNSTMVECHVRQKAPAKQSPGKKRGMQKDNPEGEQRVALGRRVAQCCSMPAPSQNTRPGICDRDKRPAVHVRAHSNMNRPSVPVTAEGRIGDIGSLAWTATVIPEIYSSRMSRPCHASTEARRKEKADNIE